MLHIKIVLHLSFGASAPHKKASAFIFDKNTVEITIASVMPDSPAARSPMAPGDRILAINGRTDLEDLFDYQFEMTDAETAIFTVRHADGSEESVTLGKAPDADPGLVFTSPIFTPIKTCNNACPFCFIDQQPAGLRASLYVKDDDYRLSYFNNTYITLTNLTDRDRARIEMLRPGPLYISVHATEPAVRERLLVNTRQAGRILTELTWLAGLDIPFHCQVVICPGINDGEVLSRTLADLARLRPEALSVAVVPVGLTQYRTHLPALVPVSEAAAQDVISRVAAFEETQGRDFVYLSDEFYFKAGMALPATADYGDFPQLDDGVGSSRMLLSDFHALVGSLPLSITPARNFLLITGPLGAMTLAPIAARLNEISGLYCDVFPVESRFWGVSQNVAGLVTGTDILEALASVDVSGYTAAVLPSVMLKEDTETFLDGRTVTEVSTALGFPFRVVPDATSARALVDCLITQIG